MNHPFLRIEVGAEMKVTIMASFPAVGDMYVNASQM